MELKKAIATLILGITVVTQALATTKPTETYQTVISHYMDSYKASDYKKLRAILAEDAVFKSNRDVRVVKQSGEAIIGFLKKKGLSEEQDCNLSYEIISKTNAIVIAKVSVKYELFNGDQDNFLVIENQGKDEWKITQVYKMYLENNINEKSDKKILAANK
ncbi:hypothetical protein GM921_12180 [Pedobacter sp. LMG 31464]|uniref:Lumazine-binding n=1 Tax=Pedobacter planticolens TaxID=2679964 RepID=A0A923IWJ5_9SPHI|nr:nuclear transport factor 2 family protein [Pedobacter planticolens]MBB2146249.1 hypothetical protein [Pedobacter planticolens]